MNLGIDIGGTDIKFGMVDTANRIIARAAVPTPKASAEAVADAAAAGAKQLLTAHPAETVGVGTPGIVTPDGRVSAANLPFADTPLADLIASRIGHAVALGNDANCAALGEAAVSGADDLLLITLGTGVGGGIVTDGKIYTGFNGLAAELGHFVIQKDGVPCGCGRRGCFEAYASATALIRMTKEELDRCFVSGEGTLMAESRKLNARVAFDAYRAGDAAAKRVIETYIGYLASGIASLINIFQPEVFIIGGGVSNEKQFLLDLLLPRIDAEDFAKNAKKRTRIVIATCGNDAGIIGAAMNE